MRMLIATRNHHKVGEIQSILGPQHDYFTLNQLPGAPAVLEDAPTFEGNATKKAVSLANWLAANHPGIDYVLADDSGLEVDALGGAPGVYSARYAALDSDAPGNGNSPDAENNARLLRGLAGVRNRAARFRCVIAFTPVPEGRAETSSPVCAANQAELATELFSGACEGRILESPRGAHGFGYDPLFVPVGFAETFAELGEEQKNRISHRSKALAKLKERLGQTGRE